MKNNLNVPKIIFISLAMMVLLSSQVCAAKSEAVTVSISPVVQEQIQQASPNERKKMEAAISTGNKFIPHHFNGKAYARNDEKELKFWMKNIRPLVNRVSADWYNPGEIYAESAPALVINGKKVHEEVVCPQPELISVNRVNDQFQLNYRTKIIGMWKTNSKMVFTQGDIVLNEKEEFDEVLLTLDKNNRVSQVASKYAVLPMIPNDGVDMFESYIKWPLYQSPWQESLGSANTRILQYKQYIKLIKNEEAASCKGVSVNIKQSIERE